jgi:hypothetical protein
MNDRQQKYKKNRLLGMNQVNAARAAGYSEKYSRQACRIERSVKVSMADAFERAGLTDKAIVAHALEGLNASKVISCNVIAPDGEGMKDANSMTKDFVDVPDWQSRHKYFETILKLTELLKEKFEVTHTHFFNEVFRKYDAPPSRIGEYVNSHKN